MATAWLTYCWKDDEDNDVTFVAQELEQEGLTVQMDKWDLVAGQRLWDQIEEFITDQSKTDAWCLYATQGSLDSERCQEEYAYALDRALSTRGPAFPIIGIFPSTFDPDIVPAGLRTRLCVSTTEPGWAAKVAAGAEGRAPARPQEEIEAFHLYIHRLSAGGKYGYAVEMRPRAGTWSPFVVAIPAAENDDEGGVPLTYGPKSLVPMVSNLSGLRDGNSEDRVWRVMQALNEASPTQSYYLRCKQLPSRIAFGQAGNEHNVSLSDQGRYTTTRT